MRTGRTRRLACESLESRLCMAGNMLPTVTNGVFYVQKGTRQPTTSLPCLHDMDEE